MAFVYEDASMVICLKNSFNSRRRKGQLIVPMWTQSISFVLLLDTAMKKLWASGFIFISIYNETKGQKEQERHNNYHRSDFHGNQLPYLHQPPKLMCNCLPENLLFTSRCQSLVLVYIVWQIFTWSWQTISYGPIYVYCWPWLLTNAWIHAVNIITISNFCTRR